MYKWIAATAATALMMGIHAAMVAAADPAKPNVAKAETAKPDAAKASTAKSATAKADAARKKPLQRCDELNDKAELECLRKARERIVEARKKRESAGQRADVSSKSATAKAAGEAK